MLTLFDLLPTRKKKPARQRGSRGKSGPAGEGSPPPTQLTFEALQVPAPRPEANGKLTAPRPGQPRRGAPMQERYDALVREMKQRYGLRVVRWRKSMSGVAWQVVYRDGSIANLIEAPYPRGPMSAAIFLHEVGHHAIGLQRHKPRCLEELLAWEWSLKTMEEFGFNVTDRVRQRMEESLRYAVAKARRRGLKRLPTALLPYL
ncbi:MAG: hypothetical protein ACF8NJ_07095 [Phycisphaerales bacterium JB038]